MMPRPLLFQPGLWCLNSLKGFNGIVSGQTQNLFYQMKNINLNQRSALNDALWRPVVFSKSLILGTDICLNRNR